MFSFTAFFAVILPFAAVVFVVWGITMLARRFKAVGMGLRVVGGTFGIIVLCAQGIAGLAVGITLIALIFALFVTGHFIFATFLVIILCLA